MIALRVTRRNGATAPAETAHALLPDGLMIGRSERCGLVLADPLRQVSREHAHVIPVDATVQVRCVSHTAPMWVNDVLLAQGCHRALVVGDRLRIGRFEIAVEPVAAAAAQRPRLERWFDLDGARDPRAAGSPLPAFVPAPGAAANGTFPPRKAMAPGHPTGSPAPRAHLVQLPPARVPVGLPDVSTTPLATPPELRELAAAFARGAGLDAEVSPLTAEWMEHLGALLRAAVEGTLAPPGHAVTPRSVRSEETRIAPRENKPLKSAPDATEALARMLRPEAGSGSPWRRHRTQHAQCAGNLEDGFDGNFGRRFPRALEDPFARQGPS